MIEDTIQNEVYSKAKKAKEATHDFFPTTEQKNNVLLAIADGLVQNQASIMAANRNDLKTGQENGMSKSLLDRLSLSEERIVDMAQGLREIVQLLDPIHEVLETIERPNGLVIYKKRVPIGVIGMIYEARPNVTVDSTGLCLKAGNAVVLRGGSTAIHTNIQLVEVMHGAMRRVHFPIDFLQFIEDTDRATVEHILKCKDYIDVLIPRGGHSLIQFVVQNAIVPIIETGEGVCHIYLHDHADIDKAIPISINAKCQRPSVCNSLETLLVDESFASRYLEVIANEFKKHNVQLRGCLQSRELVPWMEEATEEDWSTEYLDDVLSVKVVHNLEEALLHINQFGTKHSESIITEDEFVAATFMQRIDAAAVYHNASTRFTDGSMFGFGAEIGISTQKLHARGPMGLRELTSSKYYIYGQGQIRE